MNQLYVIIDAAKTIILCNIVGKTDNYINLNPVGHGTDLLSVGADGTVSYVPQVTQNPTVQFVIHQDWIVITPIWPDQTKMYGFKFIS